MKKSIKNTIMSIPLTLCLMLTTAFAAPTSVLGKEAENKCSYEDFKTAIKEVSYAYYMRDKNIQYNTMKQPGSFSPEQATEQNRKYVVCSAFTRNVYQELLGLNIPKYTMLLNEYAEKYKGEPEVVAFGARDESNNINVSFYGENAETLSNPTVNDIMQHVECGDVMTYSGHTIMVYDVIRDKKTGKVTEAKTIESIHGRGGGNSVSSKIGTYAPAGVERFGNDNHKLYQNLGTVQYGNLSEESKWSNLRGSGVENCSILRFVQSDKDGNAVINYKGEEYEDKNHTNEPITLNAKAKQRMAYSRLYITKTVNAFNGNIVEEGKKLTYTVTVKNKGDKNYTKALTVTENIPKYTTYKSAKSSNKSIKAKYDKKKKTVSWNIGKLKKGKSVTVSFTVTVNKKSDGKTVKSTGKVGNIATATVTNLVHKNLTKAEQTKIQKSYDKLKSKYSGKELINEIYKDALKKDLGIDKLNVTDIVNVIDKTSTESDSIKINTSNELSGMVFNNYYGALASKDNGGAAMTYDLKDWAPYGSADRRADTIYGNNFVTGDILIYNNTNDNFKASKNKRPAAVTYEDGEYAYIFIKGKGFVGINLGADGKKGGKDDRNEFDYTYYKKNALKISASAINKDEYEFFNYQTLLGKDEYVILRPALTIK